jgi:metal-responsive CopG/Arc/MetJ family transcriptional regulator
MARILVSMPDEFLNKVDGLAADEQRTRSELVREALRSYIKRSKIANPQKAFNNAEILDNLLS